MNTKLIPRSAAAVGTLAIAAAFAVSCAQAKQAGSDAASSASSVASSGASAASSAASSGASAASSAASSGASAASSAVSSVMAGTPTTLNVPGVGEVALDGPTAAKYQQLGGEGALGAPTGQAEKVGNGTSQAFAKGTIYSSPSTEPRLVQGEILKVYVAHGGPAGALGFPTSDETQTAGGPDVLNGGWISEFEHGSISWLNQGNGVFKETVTQK
jgi:uncharacterized protein with LGFP repeats